MITDKKAFRGSIELGFNSETVKSFVPSVTLSDETVEDAVRTSKLIMSITAGKQFYRGDRNLRGFYGYDGILAIARENRTKNTYGNELTIANSSSRVVKTNDGTQLSIGVRAFLGAEYYFVKNVSLSAELGYVILYKRKGGGSSNSEKVEDGNVESETTESAGSSKMEMGADVSNAKFMLNFYF